MVAGVDDDDGGPMGYEETEAEVGEVDVNGVFIKFSSRFNSC